MFTRSQDFTLGLVFLVLVGLVVGSILFIAPRMDEPMREVRVRFEHDKGLAPVKAGSAVMLSGALEIGRVKEVRLVEADDVIINGEQEPLLIEIDAEIRKDVPLYADCEIATDQPPVGGAGVLVVVSIGTPRAGEWTLADGPILGSPPRSLPAAIGRMSEQILGEGGLLDKIEGLVDVQSEHSLAYKLSLSLEHVNSVTETLANEMSLDEQRTILSKAHRIVNAIQAMTESLAGQADAEDGASAVAKVHVALDYLEATMADLTGLISDNRPLVTRTVTHVASAAEKVDTELLDPLAAELDRSDAGSLLAKIHSGLDNLDGALGDTRTIMAEGRELLVLNRPTIETTLANAQDVSTQLKLGVEELRIAPWKLLWPPGAGEQKQTQVLEAARAFAQAASELDSASSRLQVILQSDDINGAVLASPDRVREIEQSLGNAFERFHQAESFLWDQMRGR